MKNKRKFVIILMIVMLLQTINDIGKSIIENRYSSSSVSKSTSTKVK